MSTMWQKTLVYLGLVEETEDLPEHAGMPAESGRRRRPRHEMDDEVLDLDAAPGHEPSVRPLRIHEPGSAHVRAMPAAAGVRTAVVAVTGFADVQGIGTRLREQQPVVIDASGVGPDEAKRVLDFVSGATFALGGRLQPLRPRAFLALPDGRELVPEERERIASLGYAKQHA